MNHVSWPLLRDSSSENGNDTSTSQSYIKYKKELMPAEMLTVAATLAGA